MGTEPTRAGGGDGRRITLLVAGVVAFAAALVYANSLANGFAYDDETLIATRELVHGLGRVGEVLTSRYWPGRYDPTLYRPLTLLTYTIDWTLWNGNPLGFHLVNVLLHVAVSVLVVVFLLRLFPWWAALTGGVIFAVHSVHTEAVANVVGRAELLATLFVLGACLVYARTRERGLSAASIAAILLLYACASLSKEVGFVLPGLLLATDLPAFVRGRLGSIGEYARRRAPLFAGLALTLALLLAARWAVLGAPLGGHAQTMFVLDQSFLARLFTMIRVWPRYVELLLFPLHLSADYSPAVILPADRMTLTGALGIALFAAAAALTALTLRRAPEVSMSLAWAAISLLPVSNLVVTVKILLAERTLYLPSVAIAILAALLFTRTAPRWRKPLLFAAGVWILLFSTVTVRRNPVWKSTTTVFDDLRRDHPESARLLYWVANRYYLRGDWETAREWFRRSMRVWPYDAVRRRFFGWYLYGHGELQEAEENAAAAVSLEPGVAANWALLAQVRLKAEDRQGALDASRGGLDAAGDDAGLHAIMARAYQELGRPDSAILAQRRAVAALPPDRRFDAMLRLASLQWGAGDSASAEAMLRRAGRASDARPGAVDSLRRAWNGAAPGGAGVPEM